MLVCDLKVTETNLNNDKKTITGKINLLDVINIPEYNFIEITSQQEENINKNFYIAINKIYNSAITFDDENIYVIIYLTETDKIYSAQNYITLENLYISLTDNRINPLNITNFNTFNDKIIFIIPDNISKIFKTLLNNKKIFKIVNGTIKAFDDTPYDINVYEIYNSISTPFKAYIVNLNTKEILGIIDVENINNNILTIKNDVMFITTDKNVDYSDDIAIIPDNEIINIFINSEIYKILKLLK